VASSQHQPHGPPGFGSERAHGERRRGLAARAAWPLLALAALGLVALTLVTSLSPPSRHTLVVASMPFWNMSHDTSVVLANTKAVNEVSPWIYGLNSSGEVTPMYPEAQGPQIATDLKRLEDAHLRMVPSIANITDGKWAYQPLARILHDPALARQHVEAIVSLVQREKYAGIDIDYEELHAGDQRVYTQFIAELARALHAHGKILSVAVFPQTGTPAPANPNSFQDYAALGKAADQVRIMGYNFHWANSRPGATAPISWVRSVLGYAKSQMPASKVVLGIPLFGYDWPDGTGPAQTVSWLQALRLSRQFGATARYDKTSQAPFFSYASSGRTHTVWFENAASSRAKFEAVKGSGVAGVFLWMYGYEDPGTWPALHSALPVSGPGASSTSKAVP